MKKARVSSLCLMAFIFLTLCLSAEEILMYTEEDEQFLLKIESDETVNGLKEKIIALAPEGNSHIILEVAREGSFKSKTLSMSRNQGGYLGFPRDYYAEVTPEEKADIRYLVTTIANKSLIAIALAKNEMEEAGNRIDHLHPLRFLMTIFADEELKAGIRNIRGRGWLWNQFTGGLKDSLATEMNIGNLKEVEHVGHFCGVLSIDPKVILPAIRQQKWDDFIDLLITHIPRSGNHDRYDT